VSSEVASNGAAPVNGNGHGNGTDNPEWQKLQKLTLLAGIIGIGVFAVLGVVIASASPGGTRQFFTSYLVGWVFWLSLPIGCMGFLGIHYITGSSWGVLLRRMFEAATRTLPLMAVLFIPIAVSTFSESASPYPWSRPMEALTESQSQEVDWQAKFDNWLNPKFFALRAVLYFAIWGVTIFFINKWSNKVEATGDIYARRYMENFSGPVIFIFALFNMFAATDFVMSIELNFSSTMFALIYSINQLLTCFTFGVAVFLTLATISPLKEILRPKFQIDMGSFMLALCLVWCYMNFSQYMLIWIANLPEEIPYYLKRTRGGWEYVAYIMLIFHFAMPFVLLLFRDVKLHRGKLRAMAIFLFCICALDVIWWLEPATDRASEGLPLFLLMDVAAVVGIGGIWGFVFLGQLKKYPLLPTQYLSQLPGAHHAH